MNHQLIYLCSTRSKIMIHLWAGMIWDMSQKWYSPWYFMFSRSSNTQEQHKLVLFIFLLEFYFAQMLVTTGLIYSTTTRLQLFYLQWVIFEISFCSLSYFNPSGLGQYVIVYWCFGSLKWKNEIEWMTQKGSSLWRKVFQSYLLVTWTVISGKVNLLPKSSWDVDWPFESQ